MWYWVLLEQSANFVESAMMLIFLQQFFELRYKSKWPVIFSIIGVFFMIFILNYFKSFAIINLVFFFGRRYLSGISFLQRKHYRQNSYAHSSNGIYSNR